MSVEPAKIYWVVAIAGSLALHAGAVGAAAMLMVSHGQKNAVTEITFSAPPPSAAGPVARTAEKISALKQVTAPADRAARMEYQALQPAKPAAAVVPESLKAASSIATVPTAAVKVAPVETAPLAVQSRLVPDTVQQTQSREAMAAEMATDTAHAPTNTLRVPTDTGLPALGVQRRSPVRVQPTERVAAVEIAAPAPLSSAMPSVTAPAAPSSASTPTAAPLADRTRADTATASQNADPRRAVAPSAASAVVANAPAKRLQPVALATGGDNIPSQRLQPVAPAASGITPASAATPSPQPENAPVVGSTEVALLVPARPGSSLGTETDQPSQRYREVIDFIRGYGGGDCFVALPAISSLGVVEFQTFGKDKAREAHFTDAFASALGIAADVSLGDVADPQCLALSFARNEERYPAFSLIIELDKATVISGSNLSGAILNVSDRPVHLLLIDDEGRVQAVDRFLTKSNRTDRQFSTPVSLTSGPVATKQLLMAIAADQPVQMLDGKTNELATDFFPRLAKEIAGSGADVDIALEAFSVW